MIAPDDNKNLGGICQIDIIPHAKAVDLREKDMSAILFIQEGASLVTAYRTYRSDRVQCTPNRSDAGNAYGIEIRWLIAKERLALWQSIREYLNGYVLVVATLGDGSRKLFGSIDYPLLLTANPTPQTTPDSFNGVEITCSGTDILPGRFLFDVVEAVA